MKFDYREPMDKSELDALFRLRHTIYSEDDGLNSMVSASATHDINEFDATALHFGGFDGKFPIACIRITTGAETRFTPWVNSIMSDNNIKTIKRSNSFPFQQHYPNTEWASGFMESLKGCKIGEVGKLAIHKDYRKGGVVLNDLISSFVDYCKTTQKFNTGFGICTHALERYYRKFGFSIVEGSRPFVSNGLPEAVIMRFDN